MTLIVAHQGKLYADRYYSGGNPRHTPKLYKSECGKYAFAFTGSFCVTIECIVKSFSDWVSTHFDNIVVACHKNVSAMKEYLMQNPVPFACDFVVLSKEFVLHVGDNACLHSHNVTVPLVDGCMRKDFLLVFAHYADVPKSIEYILAWHCGFDVNGVPQYDQIGIEELV